ncbi:hypothetical protein D6C91_07438 [Aureobasidium pullulans]|uniref:Ubiquitin 3 binding protein But2 C-terminal domain-containing protein n=1 Tax=Aureobasidium pullulans TaxID=5580 RepID=A0A4V4KIA3_AURPU|nr:hypothetical protein D6C91_07438 [Aureobasidium pullulans]
MPGLFSTLLALAATVAAVPTSKQPSCPAVSQNANFDDLTALPLVNLSPLPTPYKGLYFQAFDFATVIQTGLLPGPVPHSGSNYAFANLVSELQGTPMITTNYQDSKTKSFDLKDFYFSCVLNLGQGATALNQACNVEVTGYQGSDNSVSNAKQVCSQQFQFNPSSALAVQQLAYSGPVKGCEDIQFAVFTFSVPGGEAAVNTLNGLVIDDVRVNTRTC